MRDALSLLDQCLGRDRHVTLDIVNQTAGVAGREYLSALTQAVAEEDPAAALSLIDGLYRESKDMGRLCEELGEYFRGLMLAKTMKDPSPLLAVSPQEVEVLTAQALSMSLPAILHGLDVLEETLQKMRFGNQRALLEMAFVKLCDPQLDDSPQAILRRLEALERGHVPLPQETAEAPAPAAAPPQREAPPKEEGGSRSQGRDPRPPGGPAPA